MASLTPLSVEKLATHIPGFDLITEGGLPRGRTTLIAGTPGSAKTIFAVQFLAEGILQMDDGGVFVTFEESPDDIRANMRSFGWDILQWEADGRWAFVDASPQPGEAPIVTGSYDLGALLVRIEYAIKRVGATRIALDSLGSVFTRFTDHTLIRSEFFRLATDLKRMWVTAIMTAERTTEYGAVSRYGVEEFVADNVILLRNVLENEKRRRTIEALKFRGTSHQRGEYPFTVSTDHGVTIIPAASMSLVQHAPSSRLSSGNAALDCMCGGGFFGGAIVLVSGATGTGKTLVSTEFMAGGASAGDRCLLFAFEESAAQLHRNAAGWGIDFAELEAKGVLKISCAYPEAANLEDCLMRMKAAIKEFNPQRVAVDSLSGLQRISTPNGFREFVVGLTAFIKEHQITGLFTLTTSSLFGSPSITEDHFSTITDTIIMLRYVEMFGEVARGLAVLKMRGSMHDKGIREFSIDSAGLHIGAQFHQVSGILTGSMQYVSDNGVAPHNRVGAMDPS